MLDMPCARGDAARRRTALRAAVRRDDEPHPRHFDDVATLEMAIAIAAKLKAKCTFKEKCTLFLLSGEFRGTCRMSRNKIWLPGIENAARLVGNTRSTSGILSDLLVYFLIRRVPLNSPDMTKITFSYTNTTCRISWFT